MSQIACTSYVPGEHTGQREVPGEPCCLREAVSSRFTLCYPPDHQRVLLVMLAVTPLEST